MRQKNRLACFSFADIEVSAVKTFHKTIFWLLVFQVASVPLALAQGTYTQIDVPGAIQTVLVGINTAGDMVGTYESADANWHGFLLSGGSFTTIDYPGGNGTYAYGINDLGQIVGTNGFVGFLYDVKTQTFTTFSFPNPHAFTEPYSINNAGTIVGNIVVNGSQRGFVVGFVLSGGAYKIVVPKPSTSSEVTGINNFNQAVGSGFNDTSPTINFIFDQGRFQPVKVRAEVISGINDSGVIVGTYRQRTGIAAGFVYQGGTLQPLVFPGGVTGTVAFSINNSGVVAGWFVDAGGATNHGFTWTPPGDAAKK